MFGFIKERKVDFNGLKDLIDDLTTQVDQDDKKNSFKLLGFIPCEQQYITGVFAPLGALLWTGIIHTISLLQNLFSTSYK